VISKLPGSNVIKVFPQSGSQSVSNVIVNPIHQGVRVPSVNIVQQQNINKGVQVVYRQSSTVRPV